MEKTRDILTAEAKVVADATLKFKYDALDALLCKVFDPKTKLCLKEADSNVCRVCTAAEVKGKIDLANISVKGLEAAEASYASASKTYETIKA